MTEHLAPVWMEALWTASLLLDLHVDRELLPNIASLAALFDIRPDATALQTFPWHPRTDKEEDDHCGQHQPTPLIVLVGIPISNPPKATSKSEMLSWR